MFKLKIGDVVKLNEIIQIVPASYNWKTGFYKVTDIRATFCHKNDAKKPVFQSYIFDKIKKDGTVIKSHCGYNCLSWDKMIESGKVTIVSPKESD